MSEMQEDIKQIVETVTKKLVDEGKIVEAGWQGMKMLSISPQAPEDQLREMRFAFFCGAHHLFASIMNMLSEGGEPQSEDESRMDNIAGELKEFERELKESMV